MSSTEVRGPLDRFVRLRKLADSPSVQPTGTPPATVSGGHGVVPASPINTASVPAAAPKLSPKDAERLLLAELLGEVRKMAGVTTELTARLGGRQGAVNGVLLVRLVSLGTEGRWGYAGPVAVGSAVVTNHHATLPMYVQSGDSGTAPGVGLGVQLVPAGGRCIMPVGAHALTIWGPTDGALASVQLYTGLQPYGVTV